MESDNLFETMGGVLLLNVGSWLIANLNPILGTASLTLSCIYVGFKAWKEYREYRDNKDKDKE